MSVRTFSEIWEQSSAKGSTLLVALALGDIANDEGVCWPSEERLASKARMSERGVRRALQELRERGELEVWEWFAKGSGRKRNCYRLLVGELAVYRGLEPEEIAAKATILRRQIPTAVRRAVFDRDGWRCVDCGSHENLTIDHVFPVSKGGGDEPENLATRCMPCNLRKSDKTPAATGQSGRLQPASPGRSHARVPDVEVEPSVEEGAKAPSSRKRNLVFDAIAEATQADPELEGGRIVAAMKLIRGACKRERDGVASILDPSDEQIAEEVHRRAALYRERWPDVDLTPTALARNWRRVLLEQPRGGMTPEQIVARADAEERGTITASGPGGEHTVPYNADAATVAGAIEAAAARPDEEGFGPEWPT